MHDTQTFRFWAVVSKAPDVEDQWISHCLDYDIMSLGNNPAEALEMLKDAVVTVLVDDFVHGLHPSSREPAPAECWASVERVLGGEGESMPFPSEGATGEYLYVSQLNLQIRITRISPAASNQSETLEPLVSSPSNFLAVQASRETRC